MYNLLEYSDNYSDTSGSLWQFKRDEVPADKNAESDNYSDTSGSLWQFKRDEVPADNNADLSNDNSKSFKYKALVGKTKNHNDGKSSVENTKIVVPLKYLSGFWRSLEIPLINCKVHPKLNWIKD